ncbi:YL1 nuclear protein-domain-containing protein [Xylariaceae sp. FL0255]|nr:YL1 nuclear protein-domain-containing protein [Xylariaceae sp. FL0255]
MSAVEDERATENGENDPAANLSDSNDSDDNSSSDGGEHFSKVEWLATGREKRSTAGNRMESMIAAEEPDDELELLFAEDGDDAGFTDAGEDASDVQMDSSSDDEDAQENGDDLEGEKELEKQARESRQAARKRKAQEAIPLKFRKRVKIDTSRRSSTSATPTASKPPRPKKKSERLSWLPTVADLPTRASKRETTMAGKEQLHKQMAEREFKRLKQIEAMERKAKKLEALKKPPMTQAERLAEAALVEKRNAKSLNRWEEAEKQREEERRAKLAALNNRTLEGPVVTFWSGVGEWVDGKLKHVGKIVTIEEKPAKKKRVSVIGTEGPTDKPSQAEAQDDSSPQSLVPLSTDGLSPKAEATTKSTAAGAGTTPPDTIESSAVSTSVLQEPSQAVEQKEKVILPTTDNISNTSYDTPSIETTASPAAEKQSLKPPEPVSQIPTSAHTDIRPPDLKPPDIQSPSPNMYTTSMFAPLSQPSPMKPPNSYLAPPAGVFQNGLSMPVIGYHSSGGTPASSILAPPNPTQRQSPLSMPQTNIGIHPPPPAAAAIAPPPNRTPHKPAPSTSIQSTAAFSHTKSLSKPPLSSLKLSKVNIQSKQSKETALPSPPSPPPNGKATRNCIILQNFNENAIREKSVQTRILFDREMNKLPKQGPAPRCVITNLPAKYRDPKTGLLYHNAHAFKEIRKLCRGHYKWSALIGAWVGDGTTAARGVPARFLDPNAPGPVKANMTAPDSSIDGSSVEKMANDPNTKASGLPGEVSQPSVEIVKPEPQINQDSNPGSTMVVKEAGPAHNETPSTMNDAEAKGNNGPDLTTGEPASVVDSSAGIPPVPSAVMG